MSRRPAEPEQLLVFGEDRNDRESLRELIEGLCPRARGHVNVVRTPLVLIKGRAPAAARDQAQRIAGVVRAANERARVICTFLHEDCDQVEPAHEAIAEKIELAVRAAKVPGEVHAVVPAWEIEAWWFLWPAVLRQLNKHWTLPSRYSTGEVGKIRDAKQVLKRELVRGIKEAAKHEYREQDSPRIARTIREQERADAPPAGRSRSFDRFRSSVKSCCEKLAGA